jgi:cell division protease FtsH
VVLVLSPAAERGMGPATLKLEGVARSEGAVAATIAAIRAGMREHNVFRGRVISLHADQYGGGATSVQFHALPAVPRDGVILPAGTLERLERHAIGIAAEAERLGAAGRHLKRGILLHGPPGTGKTLSVTYLLGAMPGRTVVLLTGRSLGLIEHATTLARELAPATVVFEDIDLVAAERTMPWSQGVLFDLLNQMEGVGEDADLLFLLTTNRPDVIEPALAARPGRVDLALEVPLPDADARGRLIDLYAGDVRLSADERTAIVQRTEGVSGAFVKELMRQATLRAATADRAASGADALAALDELLEDRSALTRRLLGQPAHGAPGDGATGPPMPQMLRAFEAAGLPIPDDVE